MITLADSEVGPAKLNKETTMTDLAQRVQDELIQGHEKDHWFLPHPSGSGIAGDVKAAEDPGRSNICFAGP